MRRAVLTLLLLALPVLGPATAAGQEAAPAGTPRLEALLPADTFFVASVPDAPSLCDQLSRTALGKLWREPEMQQFLAPALDVLHEKLAKIKKMTGHSLGDIAGFLNGQIGLAVIQFDPMLGGLIPDAVLYVDLGARKDELAKHLGEMLGKVGPRMAVRPREHNGVSYTDVTLPQGIEISFGYFGSALVLTSRPDRMPKLVDAWKNAGPGLLTANPTFRASMAKVAAGSFVNAFVNVESIHEHFASRIPPMPAKILDATGLTGVLGLSMGSRFEAEGIRDTFFAYAPGEKRGMLKLFYTANGGSTDLLSRVPKGAFYAVAGRSDLDESVGIMMEMAGSIQPEMVEKIQMGLAQAREMLGVDIRKDLLEPLGDEFAAYVALPEAGGLFPDMVMLAKLDDPARFENAVTQIVARGKMFVDESTPYTLEHRRMTLNGKTIHYVHVAHRYGTPFPFTPSFVIDGDVVAMALFPQPLKDWVSRGADAESVMDRPDFARVMKGLPKDLSSVEYVDLAAGMRLLYGTLVPILQAAGKDQRCPVDMALLPRTETMAKHLFGAAWGLCASDEGIEFHAYSQVGSLPVMAMSLAPMILLSGSMATVEMEAPQRIRVVPPPEEPTPPEEMPEPVPQDTGNPRLQLKEIYISLLYSYAEKSAYPENLGALVESHALETAKKLLLPGDDAPLATGGGHRSSFAYVGPKVGNLRQDTSSAVWVYERDGLAAGARWVLFADGSVRRVAEAQFQALLAKTRKMLAK